MEFLSTHLHCNVFEDFYDKTLLCVLSCQVVSELCCRLNL